ncbi:MAG: cupin domain-containing protein [Candidatus Hinthialibacter antarcticus]|nr:cupin domain-containing protein [Candidatus Hinthialibacter antarcticus]
MTTENKRFMVRYEEEVETEKSTCGWRKRLVSREDKTPAYLHTVHINGSKAHYHNRATEFYYVLNGEGSITLDGASFPLKKGMLIQIDPGCVHSSEGDHEVLVIGIPDIAEDDIFFTDDAS